MSSSSIRHYALVTAAYWGFTLTDGALRMLVLLHFHQLGYAPAQIALLFLLYEFFGVVTNLLGGWIGAHTGLRVTLFGGLALQVFALIILAGLDPAWPVLVSVSYVMAAQALSGIAKDLTKMSAKSAIKLVVDENAGGTLFRWVAALKGAGFFLGGLLLATLGFERALLVMAAGLFVVLALSVWSLPSDMGRARQKRRFTQLFSKSARINLLSIARFFLFGSRDLWFVVGLPLFLAESLGWSHTGVGGFLALWVIGYGFVQAVAPRLIRRRHDPRGSSALLWVTLLALVPAGMLIGLAAGLNPAFVVVGGLAVYGAVFAINSAIHSYLILAYSSRDEVAMDVGFYYMANAGGRLVGTLFSGLLYQYAGLAACLAGSLVFLGLAAVFSLALARRDRRVALPSR
jgi:predicted MFS family arabinose efflux permease